MSERFIKFIPSTEAMYLLTQKGHAFRLLTIIAECARRYDGDLDGLKAGEALIGGHENYDMTESNYRSAKGILIRRSHILLLETCRTRQKITTGITTIGTRVKLISSSVYDININEGHDRTHDLLTTDSRPTHDEQEDLRRLKKEKIIDLIDGEENLAELFVARCKGSPSVISIPKEELKNLFKEEGFSLPEITSAMEKFKGKNPVLSNNFKNTFINYLRSILDNQKAETCKKKSPKKNLKTSSTAGKGKCLVNGTSVPILERLMRLNGHK